MEIKKLGKTIISILLALNIKKKNILLIDFNLLNNNLHTFFQIKKYSKNINNNFNFKNLINKINKNLDVLIGTDIILKNNLINKNDLAQEVIKISKNYDYIIIDNEMEKNGNILNEIFNISNKNILVTEPNITELTETKSILEECFNSYGINKEKILILFNKCNKYSIDQKILEKLFSDFKIIGKINYNIYYNFIVNNYNKIIPQKIKKEYKKIIKEII